MTVATGKKARAPSASTCSARCTPRSATSTRSSASSRITSLVNSASDFTEHHLVTNGCSELFGEVSPTRRARAQRLRRRPAAARRLRRDRADRPGRRRRMSAARRGRLTFGPLPSGPRNGPCSPWSPSACFAAVGVALVSQQHVYGMEPRLHGVLQRLVFLAIGAVSPCSAWSGASSAGTRVVGTLGLLLAADRPGGGALAALRRCAVRLVQADARRPDRQRHRAQHLCSPAVRGARQLRRRGGVAARRALRHLVGRCSP